MILMVGAATLCGGFVPAGRESLALGVYLRVLTQRDEMSTEESPT